MRDLHDFNELTGNSGANPWCVGSARFDPATLSLTHASTSPILTAAELKGDFAFVADPFRAIDGSVTYVFAEVWKRPAERGEIAVFQLNEQQQVVTSTITLSEDFHLSYPSVFRVGADWYMLPEAWESGRLTLYKADEFPVGWKQHTTLLELDYADPQLFVHDGLWYLFLTRDPSRNTEAALFWSESLFGPWREHAQNPVIANDARHARSAGPLLRHGDRLLRFTQDCRARYGDAVVASRIVELTPTVFRAVPIGPVLLERPSWARDAFHHLHAFEEGGMYYALFDGYTASEPSLQ